jgi:hypothetical protein
LEKEFLESGSRSEGINADCYAPTQQIAEEVVRILFADNGNGAPLYL